MKRTLLLLLALLLIPAAIWANGLSLNSIGPKAFGMGGAFVGLADDHTALYWNPAGLIHLEGAYIGAFVTDVVPMGTYKLDLYNIDAKTKTNHYVSPNLMAYWQCLLTDRLKIGLGAYVPAGLGTEWDGADLSVLSGGQTYKWMSRIGVINFSPAISFKLSENLSLGAALNVFYGMFDLKRPDDSGGQYSESSNGLGYGVTVGALAKLNKMISVGLSVRTKTNVTMSGEAENPAMANMSAPTKSDFDRDVAWPLWVAGGVAVRPVEKLTLTADLQWSQWKESEKTFTTKYKDPTWKAASEATGGNKFNLLWKNALQIRVGAQYQYNDALALRTGYYHDPGPAPDITYNILFPSITYNGVTAGASYELASLKFDFGIEYLFGQEREISFQSNDNMMGIHNMDIFSFSFGVGYFFK